MLQGIAGGEPLRKSLWRFGAAGAEASGSGSVKNAYASGSCKRKASSGSAEDEGGAHDAALVATCEAPFARRSKKRAARCGSTPPSNDLVLEARHDGQVQAVDGEGASAEMADGDCGGREMLHDDGGAREMVDDEGGGREVVDEDGGGRKTVDDEGSDREVVDDEGGTRVVVDDEGGRREVMHDDGGGRKMVDDDGGAREMVDEEGGGRAEGHDGGVSRQMVDDEGGGRAVVDDEGGSREVVDDEGGSREVVKDEGGGREVMDDEGVSRGLVDDEVTVREIADRNHLCDLLSLLWHCFRAQPGDEDEDARRASALVAWAFHHGRALRSSSAEGATSSVAASRLRQGAAHELCGSSQDSSLQKEFGDALSAAHRSLQSSAGEDNAEVVARHGLLSVLDSIMERVIAGGRLASEGQGAPPGCGLVFAARVESLLNDAAVYGSLLGRRTTVLQRLQWMSHAALQEERDRLQQRARDEEASTADADLESDCVVCWTYEAAVALLPCGHVCLCCNCSALSICPMSVEHVFVAWLQDCMHSCRI